MRASHKVREGARGKGGGGGGGQQGKGWRRGENEREIWILVRIMEANK